MRLAKKRFRNTMWLLALVALCGLVAWAAKELSGQANSMSQEAGANSLDYEIAALDSMESVESEESKPQPPPCDWVKLRDLRHEIESNNVEYQAAVTTAQQEMDSQGGVTSSTKGKVLGLAEKYKKANEATADLYDGCNCGTRARTHRELAATRLASAEVVVANEIDSDKLEELEKNQDRVAEAHTEYAESVDSGDVSDDDKKRLHGKVLPKIDRDLQGFQTFVQNVANLVREVKASVDDVKNATQTRNPIKLVKALREARQLFKHVQALSNVAQRSEQNMRTIQSNARRLAG